MNTIVIQKPAPHCPIPEWHQCHIGYVSAEKTDIRLRFKRLGHSYGDDYDMVTRQDWLSAPGGFR
jgi:hypothetical protein